MAEQINQFNSTVEDLREALKGTWGSEIKKDCKIAYLGTIIIASGDLNIIKLKCNKTVYEWEPIGTNLYIGWIKQ